MAPPWIWTLGLTTAGLALALVFWALFWDRPRGRLRCPKCWYDLRGSHAPATCPECGRSIASTRHMRRTRRRWSIALPALLIASAAGWVAPTWTTRGWLAVAPGRAIDTVIAALFAEAADSELAAFFPEAGEWYDIPPPELYYTSRVPDAPWRRRLLAWRLARDWPTFEQLRFEDGESPRGVSRRARALSQRSDALLLVAAPAECAPLVHALGSVVADERTTNVSRGIALSVLASGGPRTEAALPLVWRGAPAVGTGQTMQFIDTVRAIDPAHRKAVGDDAALARWYERALRRPMSNPLAMQLALAAGNEGTEQCGRVSEEARRRLRAQRQVTGGG